MSPAIPRSLLRRHNRDMLWAPWRMLERDHDVMEGELADYRRWLQRLRARAWRPADSRAFAKLLAHFTARTRGHFKTEERIVFPYLAQYVPGMRPMARRLAAEHRLFRRQVAQMARQFRRLRRMPDPAASAASLCRQGLAAIRGLQNHMTREVRAMAKLSKTISL